MIIKLNGNNVEVDDNIVGEIIKLNEKGYITAACCGGHIERNATSINVTFIQKYDFPILPVGFEMNKYNVLESSGNVSVEVYNVMLRNFKEWVRCLKKNRK